MTTTIDNLKKVPMFAECTDAELAAIENLSDPVVVKKGTAVAAEGELGQWFAVIVKGTAVVHHRGTAVAKLGAGDYFGEIALLESVTRTASVQATSDLELQVIGRQAFLTLFEDLPNFAQNLAKGLVRRLVQIERELNDLKASTSR